MPDFLNNEALAIYVAATVALVVMVGFLAYLWRMDRGVRELQRMLDARERGDQQAVARSAVEVGTNDVLRPQRMEKELSNGLDRR